MRLQLVSDRGQLSLDFQPVSTADAAQWFSIDLVQRLITGERQETAELTPATGTFLRDHIREIERRFSPENIDATVAELDCLKTARAKELFG